MTVTKPLIILVLSLASASPTSRDKSPYLPCPAGYTDGSFIVHNWHNETQEDTMTVSFDLTTTFDKSATHCQGTFLNDGTYELVPCESQDSNFGTDFRATFSGLGDYIFLSHRFACLTKSPYNPVVQATGIATKNIFGLQNNTASFPGEFTVPPSAPRLGCKDILSREAKWVTTGFQYSASISTVTPPFPGPAPPVPFNLTIASLVFDILNTANDFLVHCAAIRVSSITDLEANIIPPDMSYSCPALDYGDPAYPEGTTRLPPSFPNTTFIFDKQARKLSITQRWECKDGDDL